MNENRKAKEEPLVDFPYHEIDGELDPTQPDEKDYSRFVFAIRKLFGWVDQAKGDKAKVVRIQVIKAYFSGKNQTELAKEIGVTKAAICKAAGIFRDLFKVDAPGMRSNEERWKFHDVCLARSAQSQA